MCHRISSICFFLYTISLVHEIKAVSACAVPAVFSLILPLGQASSGKNFKTMFMGFIFSCLNVKCSIAVVKCKVSMKSYNRAF